MAAADLGEHHRAELVRYMRWAGGRRGLGMKGVTSCFRAVPLLEETYTAEEVVTLLGGLEGAVLSEVELELLHFSHTNVLLLQQLFQQAQTWHLRLHTDLSELENRQLLEQVAELERHPETGPASNAKPRLAPLDGPSQLLQSHISHLEEENDKLRSRLRTLESQVTSALDDKRSAQTDLQELRLALQEQQREAPPPQNVSQLEDALANLQVEFQKTVGQQNANQKHLEEDLTGTKHHLLRIKEQLTLAEKELERKFQETAAYRNMKDMLAKKNDQIKDLRKRLAKYESQD